MLEKLIRRWREAALFRASAVGSYLDDYADQLEEDGYCRRVATSCIGNAVHFGVWAEHKYIGIDALDETVAHRFLRHLPRCRCWASGEGYRDRALDQVKIFLRYLRSRGLTAPRMSSDPVGSPRVGEFREWMKRERAVTESTLVKYGRIASALLDVLGDDPARYNAQDLRAAVATAIGESGASTAEDVSTVARALIRQFVVKGLCRPGLDAAILPVTRCHDASLPRYVSAEIVEKIISACSPERHCGVRDRAILMLLARLGLRGDDVVKLRLEDFEWERARLRVAGKGRREAWLPIPQDVGDAVIEWLRKRPRISCDRVFLTGVAPWRPLANGGTVTAIVGRAIGWAGVATPTRGAHLLRHSAATTMLQRGMSLPAIGTVLRHQSIETTVLYARVDVRMLRRIAQTWIGAASC